MALVFNPDTQIAERILDLGGLLALAGTLTASGSYAAGGDTFTTGLTPEDYLKRIGAGYVVYVEFAGGYGAEWDRTAKKLKFYTAGVEVSAGAYAAGVTGRRVVFLGK